MFGNAFSGWHLVIILFIILLLFGAPKLPGLAKSLGQSMKILRKEVGSDGEKKADASAADPVDAPAVDPVEEAARARAEAEAAKRELEELKAQAERRASGQSE